MNLPTALLGLFAGLLGLPLLFGLARLVTRSTLAAAGITLIVPAAALAALSLWFDRTGQLLSGVVVDKREEVRFEDSNVGRVSHSYTIDVDYQLPTLPVTATLNSSVPAWLFDELAVGDVVPVRHRLVSDVFEYTRLAARDTLSYLPRTTLVVGPRQPRVSAAVVLHLQRVVKRSTDDGDLFDLVRILSTRFQPYDVVVVRFRPDGWQNEVRAVDKIDVGSLPDLYVGATVNIVYPADNPREAQIIGAARSYWWKNPSSYVIGLVLASVFSVLGWQGFLWLRRRAVLLPVLTALLFSLLWADRAHSAADLPIYDDALAADWQDWSWDTRVDFDAAEPHTGEAAIGVTFEAAWAGLSLRAPAPIDAHGYQAVKFWIHGGADGAQVNFYVQSTDEGGETSSSLVDAPAGLWTAIRVDLASLGSPPALARLTWQERNGMPQDRFYLDDIRLISISEPPTPLAAAIVVDPAVPLRTFDPDLLLGTNVGAWINGPILADNRLVARTQAAGTGLIRIPGGAWSQEYGWLSCEMGVDVPGAYPCKRADDATLTDFIRFLRTVDRPAMYTVNINTTAQEAAAAVAFFNASPGDAALIGVDIHGTNWYTAGHWAQLRALHGHPDPLPIQYWDFGNETYGGIPSAGPDCPSYGWEEVWTCSGREYIEGRGSGVTRHEGYREFRAAMKAVDPTIEVGVVGFHTVDAYNGWTEDVLRAGAEAIDFFTVHPYTFSFFPSAPPSTPDTYREFLARPQTQWSEVAAALQNALDIYAGGRSIPIWVTEYNLTASPELDTDQLTTRMVTGLFMADVVGQLLTHGFAGALQWDLVNGMATTDADLSMLQIDFNQPPPYSFFRYPQYWPYVLWSRFGSTLLPVTWNLDAATELSVYAGRLDSDTVTLFAINKTESAISAQIEVSGHSIVGASMDVVEADSLEATRVRLNGISDPADNLADAPAQPLTISEGSAAAVFPPYSMMLIHLDAQAADPSAPSRTLYLPVAAR